MDRESLSQILKENGIVGAGGAGFPTYAKLDDRAEVILMNCAECEPLLKLHRQLLAAHAYEILDTFQMIADIVGADEAVIGIKEEYKDAIKAVNQYIEAFPKIRLQLLGSVYPMGDEVVLIYEAAKRVIRPGGLPIEAGVVVFNVETIYNVFRAVQKKQPVTHKLVSVVGEVSNPVTVTVPIGCKLKDVVALAGDATAENPVYFVGGPMMGAIGDPEQPVTKTTNAILVLSEDHVILKKKKRNPSIDMKRAASSCCQCEACSDLCPRNALGHPVKPHLFMRAASNRDFQNTNIYVNTLFCSSCGICEMFACPQSLSPRSLMADYKNGLRRAGVRPPTVDAAPVSKAREYRKIPEERLEARLGLTKYKKEAPLQETDHSVKQVKILLSQHIGTSAKAVVNAGDSVSLGQMIGAPADGLSVSVHASIRGKVTEVTDSYVVIRKGRDLHE